MAVGGATMEGDGIAGGDGGVERDGMHRQQQQQQQQVFNSASPIAQVLSFWKGNSSYAFWI